MTDRHYYLARPQFGPLPGMPRESLRCWHLPAGVIGAIELNPSAPRDEDRLFFAATEAPLAEYELALGSGDLRELRPDAKERRGWAKLLKRPPVGDTLAAWLAGALCAGDPAAESEVGLLLPTDGELQVHLPGHGCIWAARPERGKNPQYFNRQRDSMRKQVLTQLGDGSAENVKQVRKYLGGLLRKNPSLDWREIVPVGWSDEPLQPETTLNETFNTSDGGTVGPVYTWTRRWVSGTDYPAIYSNQLAWSGGYSFGNGGIVADADVSSSDNWADIDYIQESFAGQELNGAICRCSSSALTGYLVGARASEGQYLYKISSGSLTLIGSLAGGTFTFPKTFRAKAVGSTITSERNGSGVHSVTNTDVATGTRGGVYLNSSFLSPTRVLMDNWQLTDGISSGPAGPVLFHSHYLSQGMR